MEPDYTIDDAEKLKELNEIFARNHTTISSINVNEACQNDMRATLNSIDASGTYGQYGSGGVVGGYGWGDSRGISDFERMTKGYGAIGSHTDSAPIIAEIKKIADELYKTLSKYDSGFKTFLEEYDEKQISTLYDTWNRHGSQYEARKANKTLKDAWRSYHNMYKEIVEVDPLDDISNNQKAVQIIHHRNNQELKDCWDAYYGIYLIS